jgi:PAS domain S-box-containing protein
MLPPNLAPPKLARRSGETASGTRVIQLHPFCASRIAAEGQVVAILGDMHFMTAHSASPEDRTALGVDPDDRLYRLLVNSITGYAIFMLDPNGHVASWNLGAQRLKGYRAEEIIGRHFSTFYTEEDRAQNLPAGTLTAAARDGRTEREGWRVRKDGTRFWASVVIDAIRSPEGDLLGFAKITRDLSELKETQRALEQARESFFRAQKMEAIGQLTGGVAHDFNNLLMAVIGNLELLRKRVAGDARALQLIDNALQGAQRGSSLTQRMLAFARRQDLANVPVALGALVEGIQALLQRSLGPAIRLETSFPSGLRAVMGDPNQIELAVLNLAVNARDAMPEGGPLIIAAENAELGSHHPTGLPPGHYVCLRIVDKGTGMDAETLARATDPFFTTKGVGKGTGLGLPMVLGLAEQMGGRLVLTSQVGVGTTAEMWLPAAAPGVEPHPLPSSVPSFATRPVDVRPLTILAVDDDGLVLMNTTAMLEDLGHRVIEATSGQRALKLLENEPAVDLVITDQAMPQMTGLQLAGEIRARRPALPIIIATGYAELPPGTSDFVKLDKPFFEQQLVEAVRTAVQPR